MIWVPWKRFVVDTSWSPDIVAEELRKRITPKRFLPTMSVALPYEGYWIGENEVRFRRTARMRNGYPVAQIVIRPSWRDGTRLEVLLRPHVFACIVLAASLVFALLIAFLGLFSALLDGERGGFVMLIAPIPFYLAGWLPFALYANDSEQRIRDLFASAPALPPPVETGKPFR